MPRDNQTKMLKRDSNKKVDDKNKRKNKSSDDDSSYYSEDDDSSYETDDGDDEEQIDIHEYRKFLKTMFPSKYIDKKIEAGDRVKKALKKDLEDNESDDDDDKEEEKKQICKSNNANKKYNLRSNKTNQATNKHSKKSKKLQESDEDDEGSEEEEEDNGESNKENFKIFMKIVKDDEEYDDEYDDDDEWESLSDDNTENEDDPISDSEEEEEDEDGKEIVIKKNCKNKCVQNKKNSEKVNAEKQNDNNKQSNDSSVNESIDKMDSNLLTKLMELQSSFPDDKSIIKCIDTYKEDLKKQTEKKEKREKKEKDRNVRIFKRIIRDKNTTNDYEFYEKYDLEKQRKIIKELREINKISRVEKPYRLTLLESDIPIVYKASAMKKIASLRYMEPGSGEYYKIKNWVDTFMRIPFGEYKSLPISIEDGVDKCHEFMDNAKQTLDNAVYGLNDAKMQIMQMLGQLIINPKSIGTAIAIHGSAGTGKTTLVKEGISKILNRPFAFIALGGATDSSFLEGHGYTYEGSIWGKIVQILIDSKCMNPVIYFDELDKISDTPKGEEIAGILTHLTDTTQNSQFHDKYFSDIDFDLSKCLFIFSYNDENKVNPVLRDRMYRIQTIGYNNKQKSVIANNYLLPRIREQVKFSNEDIIIPEQTISYIIENFCNKEDGVRNLKRCLEIIHTKLNLYRLMRPNSNLFEQDLTINVSFPFTVTKDIVDKLIKKPETMNPSLSYMYI